MLGRNKKCNSNILIYYVLIVFVHPCKKIYSLTLKSLCICVIFQSYITIDKKKEGKKFLLGENPNSDGNFVWVHTLMHMFPGGTGKPLSRAALLYRMEWLVETVILTLETFKLSDNL